MASDGLFDCLEVIAIAESALSIICYYTENKNMDVFEEKKTSVLGCCSICYAKEKNKEPCCKKAKSKNENILFFFIFWEEQ